MDLVSRLRARGVRMTRQRLLVAEALVELGGYPSAREVVEALRGRDNQLSPATVYNALQAFAASGEVVQLTGPGDLMRFGVSVTGVTSSYLDEKGYVVSSDLAFGKPIARVHITYVVGGSPPAQVTASELPSLGSRRPEPKAVSRSTDPVFRPAARSSPGGDDPRAAPIRDLRTPSP